MPTKQMSVPRITSVMRWFITSKAGTKCESVHQKWKTIPELRDQEHDQADVSCRHYSADQREQWEKMFLLHSVSIYCLTATTSLRSWRKAYSSLTWLTLRYMGSGRQHQWNDADIQLVVLVTILVLFKKIVQTGFVPYSKMAQISDFAFQGND